jgi:hypothetical protein
VAAEPAVAEEPVVEPESAVEVAAEPEPEPVAETAAEPEVALEAAPEPEVAAVEPEPVAEPEVVVVEPEPVAEIEVALEAVVEAPAVVLPLAVPAVAAAQPAAANAYWMLSLYSPGAGDVVDWQRGAYALAERNGRVESPAASGERKKAVRMVVEGSVVVAAEAPVGAAPDVAPDGHPHPVYRCGHAVSILIPWRQV